MNKKRKPSKSYRGFDFFFEMSIYLEKETRSLLNGFLKLNSIKNNSIYNPKVITDIILNVIASDRNYCLNRFAIAAVLSLFLHTFIIGIHYSDQISIVIIFLLLFVFSALILILATRLSGYVGTDSIDKAITFADIVLLNIFKYFCRIFYYCNICYARHYPRSVDY